MSKVAIVGVEGSGKTVLMASLSECFGTISESDPFLMPENQSAYLFMKQVPHRLRVDREWPGATGIDALRTMRWTLRCGQTVLNTVEMLDYPGELYRLAFGERTAEELAAHRSELDEFLEHLTDADTLIVLFNLADVDNQGANARNAETVWITRGIFDYAKKLPNLKRRHLVFTQADRYAAALKDAGGADGLFARDLPMLKLLHPDLSVTAIAAVDGMDGEGRPKPGYSSGSCRELMRLILAEQDELCRGYLATCHGALGRIAGFDEGVVDDFAALVDDGGEALERLKAESLPLKSFYAVELKHAEEKVGFWRDVLHAARACEEAFSVEEMATPDAWVVLRERFADAGNLLAAFQRGYAERVARMKHQEAQLEEDARKWQRDKSWAAVITGVGLLVLALIIGFSVAAAKERAQQEQARIKRVEERARQAGVRLKEKIANLKVGDTMTVDLGGQVTMEFIWCPPGEFDMGSTEKDNEKPIHRVRLTKGFWMGKYEVTQEQWERVMGNNPSGLKGVHNPVERVSWVDSLEFLMKMDSKMGGKPPWGGQFRLPTEAEWEYACRAGTTTRFHNGDEERGLGDAAWYQANSGYMTHPVGQKKPNAWGLYDMHGNVHEWCLDWFGGYPSGDATDPKGPVSGSGRVFRGGGWVDSAYCCRVGFRHGAPPYAYIFIGFRAVLPPGQ